MFLAQHILSKIVEEYSLFKNMLFEQEKSALLKGSALRFNWSLLWFNQLCSLLFSIVHSLIYFLPLPFFLSGQSVVRRQHEAKLTLGCRVCYHDDAEEIPDLVHPTWHDLQLFISAVSLLMGTLSEPSAHFPHLSVVTTCVFCITVFYWNERRVLTVFQNVKAWPWGWFSCVLWQDHLSASLRRSAHYPHTPTIHAADAIALNVSVCQSDIQVSGHTVNNVTHICDCVHPCMRVMVLWRRIEEGCH